MLKFAALKECEKLADAFEAAKRQKKTFCITSGTQIPWDQCLEHFEKTEDWTKEKALKEISKVVNTRSGASLLKRRR